jgi:HK97 family phage major capsid protein
MPESFFEKLQRDRDAAFQTAERILAAAETRGSDTLSEIEQRRFNDARSTMLALDKRLDGVAEDERRGTLPAHLQHLGTGRPKSMYGNYVHEPATYRKGDHQTSWVKDMVRLATNHPDALESRQRLERHAEEVSQQTGTEYRDLSRVDGSGGYAVPPAWLMDQYIELARPGRAFANVVQQQTLPGGTDSINIPKLLTGTQTGIQVADNTPVVETDLTDTFINAPVRTIAGQQSLAIQLLDQSPISFDQIVFRDLVADHAMRTDLQCISGSGASGQVLGVTATPGIQTVAVTSLTIQGVYSALANSVQLVHTTRYLPPTVIVMHPRRWGWFLSLLDNQQRPLFLPAANNPMNAAGILEEVASEQRVGQLQGVGVVTDPNIPTDAGAGTNEDIIFVMRAEDLILWESGIRCRVLPEVKSSTLSVVLQAYSYLAFVASRFPQSVVAITGLTPPTWP